MDSLYLCRNGVPFDVAFSLSPEERLAWVVAVGSLDGRAFDFDVMKWEAAR